MAYTLTQVRPLLSKTELDLFDQSRAEPIRSLTAAQLRSKVTRTRALRDKYRDLLRRQTVQTRRGPAGGRKQDPATENARTRRKSEVFAEVLERFEARLQKVEADAAKASAAKASKAAKAAKATKTPKATKTAKAAKTSGTSGATRPAKAAKVAQGGKAAKAIKAAKATKGSKTAKAAKPAKVASTKGAKASKTPRAKAATAGATKSATAPKAAKASKSSRTASNDRTTAAAKKPATAATKKAASAKARASKPAKAAPSKAKARSTTAAKKGARPAATPSLDSLATAVRRAVRRKQEAAHGDGGSAGKFPVPADATSHAPTDVPAVAERLNPLKAKPENRTIHAHARASDHRRQARRDTRG